MGGQHDAGRTFAWMLRGMDAAFLFEHEATLRVASTASVLFEKTINPTMNLISCYGNWNDKTQEFDQRWIVKTALIQ